MNCTMNCYRFILRKCKKKNMKIRIFLITIWVFFFFFLQNLDIARELETVETFEDFFNFLRNRPGSGRELLLSSK